MTGYGQLPTQYSEPPLNRKAVQAFVVSLITIFVLNFFEIAVFVYAILALREISRTGERGRGLAIAALIISSIMILLLIFVIFYYAFIRYSR